MQVSQSQLGQIKILKRASLGIKIKILYKDYHIRKNKPVCQSKRFTVERKYSNQASPVSNKQSHSNYYK